MPDLAEDYLTEEEAEAIAESSEKFKTRVCDSPSKIAIDATEYYNREDFCPAYAYPLSIPIINSEIGFDLAKNERILIDKRA